MKNVFYVFSLIFFYNISVAQSSTASLFAKYGEMEDVMHLKMSGEMFSKKSTSKVKTEIEQVEVLIFSTQSENIVSEISNIADVIERDKYKHLMMVNTVKGSKINIYVIGQDGIYSSLILSSVGNDLLLGKLDGVLYKSDLDKIDLQSGNWQTILGGFEQK